MRQRGEKSKSRISKVEVTREMLTGKGGMALFARYIVILAQTQFNHRGNNCNYWLNMLSDKRSKKELTVPVEEFVEI